MQVEQVTAPIAYHGEGPVWSEQWGGLRWVDMLTGDVLSLAADGTVNRQHVGSVAAAIRPRRGAAWLSVWNAASRSTTPTARSRPCPKYGAIRTSA